MTTPTPSPIRYETSDLRVLRWFGLGASTASTVWAGFRRATIAAALLVVAGGFLVGSIAADLLTVVFYGTATAWVVHVALITAPGVVRVMRSPG